MHPRSLDGSMAPSKDTLKELGFHNINTALGNIVEAQALRIQPAPKKERNSQGGNFFPAEVSRTHKNTMLNIQSNTCHNPKQHKESQDTVEMSITA
jgi:hypothetical protein